MTFQFLRLVFNFNLITIIRRLLWLTFPFPSDLDDYKASLVELPQSFGKGEQRGKTAAGNQKPGERKDKSL